MLKKLGVKGIVSKAQKYLCTYVSVRRERVGGREGGKRLRGAERDGITGRWSNIINATLGESG